MLEREYGAPEIVNDGVTIARDIELSDPQENVGGESGRERGDEKTDGGRERGGG